MTITIPVPPCTFPALLSNTERDFFAIQFSPERIYVLQSHATIEAPFSRPNEAGQPLSSDGAARLGLAPVAGTLEFP